MRKEPLSKLKYLRNTYFCESYSLKVCNTCINIHVIIPSSTHPFFTQWPLSTRNLNLVGILWAYMQIKYKEIILGKYIQLIFV